MARRVTLSVAKKAVDSTLKRILNYTAEIIMSIILLVIICIPLGFVAPMWLQNIVLGRPRTELALDPVHWVGPDGAFWLTLLLGLISFVLGYTYILKLKPGIISEVEPEEEIDEDLEEEDKIELEEEEIEEEIEEIEEEIEEDLEEESLEESYEEIEEED
jgi:Na+/H+-dicarboxylate symporter